MDEVSTFLVNLGVFKNKRLEGPVVGEPFSFMETAPRQRAYPPTYRPLQVLPHTLCPLGMQPPLADRRFEGEKKGYWNTE